MSLIFHYPAVVQTTSTMASATSEAHKMEQLRKLATEYEFSAEAVEKLFEILNGVDFEIIADDSGSMGLNLKNTSGDPYAPRKTRWQELKDIIILIAKFAIIFDKDGITLDFLNGGTYSNITSSEEIERLFSRNPSNTTPLVRKTKEVFDKCKSDREKKKLVIIATDGCPDEGVHAFTQLLKNKPSNVYVSFVVCTDNEDDVEYLNSIDRSVPNVDVTDDFKSELAQIRMKKGPEYLFNYGSYVLKILCGAIDPSFDSLDESSRSIGKSVASINPPSSYPASSSSISVHPPSYPKTNLPPVSSHVPYPKAEIPPTVVSLASYPDVGPPPPVPPPSYQTNKSQTSFVASTVIPTVGSYPGKVHAIEIDEPKTTPTPQIQFKQPKNNNGCCVVA